MLGGGWVAGLTGGALEQVASGAVSAGCLAAFGTLSSPVVVAGRQAGLTGSGRCRDDFSLDARFEIAENQVRWPRLLSALFGSSLRECCWRPAAPDRCQVLADGQVAFATARPAGMGVALASGQLGQLGQH